MKYKLLMVPVAVMVSAMLLASPIMAKKGGQECASCKAKGKHEMKLDDKLMHKAKWLLMNSNALGLSEKQEKAIKDLKVATKKSLIKQKAEIELVATDIKSNLYEKKIDVGATNALVDKKYELKKTKAKTLVKAFADLKGTLNDGQMKKMKDIWQSQSHKKK